MRGPTAPVFFLALWLGFTAATGQHHRDKVVAFRLEVPPSERAQQPVHSASIARP